MPLLPGWDRNNSERGSLNRPSASYKRGPLLADSAPQRHQADTWGSSSMGEGLWSQAVVGRLISGKSAGTAGGDQGLAHTPPATGGVSKSPLLFV